ncbi:MAG: sulfite exporter TauE/SafE family protein [Alphaproteobacteria bacterium]|nr:sulfite exporter TauE/SafE family protein [Alphaproteobacteria bacterium]
MLIALLILLGLAVVIYGFALVRAAIAARVAPSIEALALGAVVNFLDTLGIGSFAPTTAWFKFRRMVPDRLIPPTLLCGLTPPAMTESIIYLILLGVLVDPVLLFSCVIAVFAGGLVGARLVARARVWIVQMIVAIGLVLAAAAYAMTNLHLFPGGGTANSLPLTLMIVAIIANFAFGILANFGVGNYAPTLVMLSLMGMDPRLCFPIMAGGACLMGAGSSVRHIAIGEVDMRVVLGLAIGGIPAVLVAAFLVKTMPLEYLRWLVFVVVLYAATVMAHASLKGRREHGAEPATAPLAPEAES